MPSESEFSKKKKCRTLLYIVLKYFFIGLSLKYRRTVIFLHSVIQTDKNLSKKDTFHVHTTHEPHL